jgi:DNA-directed RNA polymerase specialized sigma24 family protein
MSPPSAITEEFGTSAGLCVDKYAGTTILLADRALLDRYRIGAEEQRIVALRFNEERSQEEVAAAIGCTRRRVRTVERDVQLGLRKWLSKHGFFD